LPVEPASLHHTLWRASHVGRPHAAVFGSGFAALDAVLPGGGWPAGALTELLLPHPGVGELRLLAPVLAQLQQQERWLMWFDPPAEPCPWALQSLGLRAQQMVLVRSAFVPPGQEKARLGKGPKGTKGAERGTGALWALEHALKSGHVGAVLAWLPLRLPADALRRLQLAAQGHAGPAFLLRDEAAARQASPAALRLQLAAAAPDALRITLLKRRGPPLMRPVQLELAPVLGVAAKARAKAGPAERRRVAPAQRAAEKAEEAEQSVARGTWA
jgi:protein ImuA